MGILVTSMDRQSLQQLLSHVSRHPEVLEDLAAARDGYAQVNTYFECKDGVSLGFITVVVLGILTMWYILFTKITQGRRRRAAVQHSSESYAVEDVVSFIMSAINSGRLEYLLG